MHASQALWRRKKTAELIPMCHPIPIESVEIEIENVSETQVRLISTLRCSHKTGMEMEALTAASVAALTIYDMCKAVDRGMRIDETLLLYKDGGKSGEYRYQKAKVDKKSCKQKSIAKMKKVSQNLRD